MPLWGSVDNAANSVISAAQQVNLPVSTANRTNLYGNSTGNVFVSRATVGMFGVDAVEQQAAQHDPRGQHAGWVLRTEGQGGRSGRVFVETLVAMGSMTGDGSDDTPFPESSLTILVQPQSQSVATNTATSFSVTAEALPEGTTITYKWQRNGANINDGGIYSGANTSVLAISNTTSLNANSYGVFVYAGALTERSANAVLTVA